MRDDMKDIVIECTRTGGGYGCSGFGARRLRGTDGELPEFVSISKDTNRSKGQSDRLGPFKKFLRSNCNRPWNKVFSEICAKADSRTIRGYHLRSHIDQYVQTDQTPIRRWGHVREFFVTKHGILKHRSAAERARLRRLSPLHYVPDPRQQARDEAKAAVLAKMKEDDRLEQKRAEAEALRQKWKLLGWIS